MCQNLSLADSYKKRGEKERPFAIMIHSPATLHFRIFFFILQVLEEEEKENDTKGTYVLFCYFNLIAEYFHLISVKTLLHKARRDAVYK